MFKQILIALAAFIFCCSCASHQQREDLAVSVSQQAEGDLSLTIKTDADIPTLPLSLAGFERIEIRFSSYYDSVMATYQYNEDGLFIRATIYYYGANKGTPAEQSLDNHFEENLDAIAKLHRLNTDTIERRKITIERDGASYEVKMASFLAEDIWFYERQSLNSNIYIWVDGDRWAKIRATSPIRNKEEMSQKCEELLNGLPFGRKKSDVY